jgi:pSer/pThr/pTyr-binding forkhead associated (FHA) protein
LICEQQTLFLIDEGGPNGTWINDQRLIAKQPYALRDGDSVYFGRLGLRIFLVNQSVAGNA